MRAEGWHVIGPVSPDTVFLRAAAGDFDAVVAMYHDQGHIPSKFAGFDDTVNVTLGLPIVRTSVDHGTAYDIAGTGKANEANMLAAIDLAAQMAAQPRAARGRTVSLATRGCAGVPHGRVQRRLWRDRPALLASTALAVAAHPLPARVPFRSSVSTKRHGRRLVEP